MRARRILLALFFLPVPAAAGAGVRLNEILYDPAGPDGGAEYVELYCAGASPCPLEGLSLHFVNGSDPGRARELHRFGPSAPLPPGGFLVLGGSLVAARDIELALGLQNGPDALQLHGPGGTIVDAVAWGEGAPGGEGAPAPDPSGQPIGRVPDGADSGDNAADFVVLPAPSPSRPNARANDFALLSWEFTPAWLPRPGSAVLQLEWQAIGYAPRQEATLAWAAGAPRPLAVDRGDTACTELPLELGPGVEQSIGILLRAGADTLLALRLPVAVGPGELVLNEAMPRPASGRSEWIELHNRGGVERSLTGWTVEDADGAPREIGELRVPPGGFLVLADDPDALVGAAGPVARPEGGWPTLNNGDREELGVADWLRLRDADGRCVDELRWTASQLEEAGRALERTRVGPRSPASWVVGPAEPSPGAPNAAALVPLPGQDGLALHPQPVRFGAGEVLHIRLRSPRPGEYRAWVVDLAGEPVAELGALPSDGLAHWIWAGADSAGRRVPAGAYVLLAAAADEAQAAWRSLLIVGAAR